MKTHTNNHEQIKNLSENLKLNFNVPDIKNLKNLNTEKIIYTNSAGDVSEYVIGSFEDYLDFKQIYNLDETIINNFLNYFNREDGLIKQTLEELKKSNSNYSLEKENNKENKNLKTALILDKKLLTKNEKKELKERDKKIKTQIKDEFKKYLFSSKIRVFEISRMKLA